MVRDGPGVLFSSLARRHDDEAQGAFASKQGRFRTTLRSYRQHDAPVIEKRAELPAPAA
jgi:hypothetical protein